MSRETGMAMRLRTTVPAGSQTILLADLITQSDGIELCERRKECTPDDSRRTFDLAIALYLHGCNENGAGSDGKRCYDRHCREPSATRQAVRFLLKSSNNPHLMLF